MSEILFIGYDPVVIEYSERGFKGFIDKVDEADGFWWRVACLTADPRRDGAVWFDPPTVSNETEEESK